MLITKSLNYLSVAVAALLIFLSIAIPKNAAVPIQAIPLYPIPQIEHLSLGYNENLADMFWLRAIQDFDLCEKKIFQDRCQPKGWLYQMLLAITKLSPEFKMPMLTGPVMMSVVVGDIEGASELFDYAVKQFPKDWSIAYRAGYHALYEEKNNEKAAKLMEQAARNGAPSWVYNLATRLYTKAGEKELALRLYSELKASGNFDSKLLSEIQKRLGIE